MDDVNTKERNRRRQGLLPPKILAYLVTLRFKRQCAKHMLFA